MVCLECNRYIISVNIESIRVTLTSIVDIIKINYESKFYFFNFKNWLRKTNVCLVNCVFDIFTVFLIFDFSIAFSIFSTKNDRTASEEYSFERQDITLLYLWIWNKMFQAFTYYSLLNSTPSENSDLLLQPRPPLYVTNFFSYFGKAFLWLPVHVNI